MLVALLIIHVAATLLLAAYGCHRLYLGFAFLRNTRRRTPGDGWTDPASGKLPTVTVQIPLYNERYVASRVIAAAAALDYPRSRLEIQILDDSTDETTDVVAAAVRDLRARGIDARHERRNARVGYKAGALAHGLARARGELIAIFDADFVPQPDFLRRLVGEFADPHVGMVQARWGHLNEHTSLLTRIQALQLDAHFSIEHGARAAMGCFFNFNGTAGIWRRRTVEASGGWSADTLTEDLDLSYRAQLRGWRFVYRDDVAVPAELPVEVAAYRVQQQRWAQGGIRTAIKLLPSVVRAPVRRAIKWEAFWHLTGHVSYLLLLVLTGAGVAAGIMGGGVYHPWLAAVDGVLIALGSVALGAFYSVAARARGTTRWWRRLALVPPIMVLGAGIAFGQSAAVLRGLFGRPTPFRRTPKYRQERAGDQTWRAASYRISAFGRALTDCALGVGAVGGALLAASSQTFYPSGPIFLIGLGFATTGAGTILQHRRHDSARARVATPRNVSGRGPGRPRCGDVRDGSG